MVVNKVTGVEIDLPSRPMCCVSTDLTGDRNT